MSLQTQTAQIEESILPFANDNSVGVDPMSANSLETGLEQQYRASAYSILGALLRKVPEQEILEHVANFSSVAVDEDELLLSMSTLGLAAQSSELSAIDDEYHDLFIADNSLDCAAKPKVDMDNNNSSS